MILKTSLLKCELVFIKKLKRLFVVCLCVVSIVYAFSFDALSSVEKTVCIIRCVAFLFLASLARFVILLMLIL
jgi:hypothetical protein